jgi:(S)-citramalyl-CoA lyase
MTKPSSAASRSWLFTPATRPDRFPKAMAAGADVAIIDLEDSVAPDEKESARKEALRYLRSSHVARPRVALRINGIGTWAGVADLNALLSVSAWPDLLVLPKTETAGHLQILDRLLTAARAETRLVGIVESAAGLAAVEAISSATPRLEALMLGAADMTADLGAVTAWESLAFARSRLVVACALNNVTAIDAPFFDIHDEDGFRRDVERNVALGFRAKAAIHPKQVAGINAALTPGDAAIAKARSILEENAKGVGTVDGQMIDEAVARQARRVLAAAGLTP